MTDPQSSAGLSRAAGTVVATAAATATVVALMHAGRATTDWGWLLIPVAWVLAALAAAGVQRNTRADLGLVPPRLWSDARTFLLAAAVIFPLIFLGVWLCRRWGLALPLVPTRSTQRWAPWVLHQALYIAPAEELFFRGYVQGNLRLCLKPAARGRLEAPNVRANERGYYLRAPRDVLAAVLAAALFAGAHVAVFGAGVQAWVFFPALIFGWLRARTGGVWAPMLFHACANVAYAAASAAA